MEEIWKDIDGYEGIYCVSNLGRILSVKFGPKNVSTSASASPKIMKQSRSSSGYFHVQLYLNGESSTKLVHILVAKAFIPNPENKREVNHLDGNKENNSANNLEWVTRSENQRHAIRMGLRPKSPMIGRRGELCPSSRPVLQYDLNGLFVKKWPGRPEAARYYGCSPSSISNCVIKGKGSCLGFMWRDYEVDFPEKIEPFKRRRYAE